jgi:hypothetical protein
LQMLEFLRHNPPPSCPVHPCSFPYNTPPMFHAVCVSCLYVVPRCGVCAADARVPKPPPPAPSSSSPQLLVNPCPGSRRGPPNTQGLPHHIP